MGTSTPGRMAVSLVVAPEYGYVILVAVSSIFMIMWKGFKVGGARKKYKVNYPDMYSKDSDIFNCHQRAHQNTLENYPQFLVLLFLGGLYNPVAAAAGGAIWVAARVSYALGYMTGDPAKRLHGAYGYIGILTMLYCTVRLATGLLGWF